MIHIDDPYMPIAMSLRVALEKRDFSYNKNVRIIVREAKMLESNSITYRALTRSVYTYTTAIYRHNPMLVQHMKEDALGEREYRQLLEFFESL